MKHSVLILIAIILTGCASSGSLVVTSRITPITATVDTASIEATSSIGKVGGGMLIAVENNGTRDLSATLYDASLNRVWKRPFNVEVESRLDMGGAHIDGTTLLVPIFERMSSESFGYRLYTLDRATGRTLDSMTLMRFNQHDLGEFEEHFTGFRKLQRTPSARAIWSPDSSKFVIFKYYPSSTGRMNMELMLFRRGFVLATKTNIDFRLDPNKQNLLSLKLDNDGVAYLFKYDNVDTSFEVGRFEILGSKSLSAIKYKADDVPKIARMSIAPRGHTYLALMHEVDAGHQFSLIDFDFYRSATSMTDTVLPLDPIPLLQPQPLEIHVMPLDDRIVLTFESQSMQDLARVDQLAYNMDIQPQWHATYTKPIEFIGRHRFASRSKLLTKDLGHFFIEEDTLRFRSIDITTGRRSTDPRYERLAIAEGVQPGALDLAILDRKQLYVAAQKLFRITLP